MACGLSVAGVHVPLRSEAHLVKKHSVKLTVRDLPLHAVDNEEVRAVISEICVVTSEVMYGTVWYEGQTTSIRNGDRYMYISEADVLAFPETINVGKHVGHIFKPPALMKCRHCGEVGHKASNTMCPGHAPVELQDSVEII